MSTITLADRLHREDQHTINGPSLKELHNVAAEDILREPEWCLGIFLEMLEGGRDMESIVLMAQTLTFSDILDGADCVFQGRKHEVRPEVVRLFQVWRREDLRAESLRRLIQRYYHEKYASIGGRGLPPSVDTSVMVTPIIRHMKVWRSSSSL